MSLLLLSAIVFIPFFFGSTLCLCAACAMSAQISYREEQY